MSHLLYVHFNIIISSASRSSQWSFFFQLATQKSCTHCSYSSSLAHDSPVSFFLSACHTEILYALLLFFVLGTWFAHLIFSFSLPHRNPVRIALILRPWHMIRPFYFFLSNHPSKWQIYAILSTDTKEGTHIQQRTSAYEQKVKARSGREMSNYRKGSAEINWANKTLSFQKAHRPLSGQRCLS